MTGDRRLAAAVLALLLGCGPAAADGAKPAEPALPEPAPDSVLAFVRAHPDCLEITDACMVCRIEQGEAHCSTPGVACIKSALACSRSRPSSQPPP